MLYPSCRLSRARLEARCRALFGAHLQQPVLGGVVGVEGNFDTLLQPAHKVSLSGCLFKINEKTDFCLIRSFEPALRHALELDSGLGFDWIRV